MDAKKEAVRVLDSYTVSELVGRHGVNGVLVLLRDLCRDKANKAGKVDKAVGKACMRIADILGDALAKIEK